MPETPIIAQCDKRGQIVLSKKIREKLGIKSAEFLLYANDEGIFLKLKR